MTMMGQIKLLTEHTLYAKEDAIKCEGEREKGIKEKGSMNGRVYLFQLSF